MPFAKSRGDYDSWVPAAAGLLDTGIGLPWLDLTGAEIGVTMPDVHLDALCDIILDGGADPLVWPDFDEPLSRRRPNRAKLADLRG